MDRDRRDISTGELIAVFLQEYRLWFVFCITGIIFAFAYIWYGSLGRQYQLTEEEIENVHNYLEKEEQSDVIENYMEQSALLKVNPYKADKMTLDILAEAASLTSARWYDCLNVIQRPDVQKKLFSLLSLEEDEDLLNELFQIEDFSYDGLDGKKLMHIEAVYVTSDVWDEMKAMILEEISRIAGVDRESGFQVLKYEYGQEMDLELEQSQKSVILKRDAINKEKQAIYDGFTDAEQIYCGNLENGNSEKTVVITAEYSRWKTFILVILGMTVIVVMYLLLKLSFSERIQNVYMLDHMNCDIIAEVTYGTKNKHIDQIVNKVCSILSGHNEQQVTEGKIKEFLQVYGQENGLDKIILAVMGKHVPDRMQILECGDEKDFEVIPYKKDIVPDDHIVAVVICGKTFFRDVLYLQERFAQKDKVLKVLVCSSR